MSSGHIVDMNVRHPLREQMDREMPFDLRADCPHCKAKPGGKCFLKDWTHPARHQRAIDLDREGKLQNKTINNLPEPIKRDLVSYCLDKGLDPRQLHNASTATLFKYWCEHNQFESVLIAFNLIEEVKG